MTREERLKALFDELERDAYNAEYHNYYYKEANQIIRKHFELSLPPAEGAEKSCLNCRFHNSPTYHDKMWCRDCQQFSHYEPQPTAEGAEAITAEEFIREKIRQKLEIKGEMKGLWTYGCNGEDALRWAHEFATLHAQRIAEKMVADMRQKLFSMRSSKEAMDKLSEADRLMMYGYHDCINEMLMWTKPREI